MQNDAKHAILHVNEGTLGDHIAQRMCIGEGQAVERAFAFEIPAQRMRYDYARRAWVERAIAFKRAAVEHAAVRREIDGEPVAKAGRPDEPETKEEDDEEGGDEDEVDYSRVEEEDDEEPDDEDEVDYSRVEEATADPAVAVRVASIGAAEATGVPENPFRRIRYSPPLVSAGGEELKPAQSVGEGDFKLNMGTTLTVWFFRVIRVMHIVIRSYIGRAMPWLDPATYRPLLSPHAEHIILFAGGRRSSIFCAGKWGFYLS